MESIQSPNYSASTSYPQNSTSEMSVKDWMITLLIMAVPLVNIIMLFVWAFGDNYAKPSRSNWAKASLLWFVIIMGLYFLLAVTIFGFAFSSAFTQ